MDAAVANLISRLETVTARLESVEKQLAAGGAPASKGASSSSAASSGEDSAAVTAYQDLIGQFITPFVDLSGKVGAPEVAEQAKLVQKAINAQLDMLRIVSQSKKPASQDVVNKLIKPTSEAMGEITSLREKNRSSKFFNHLSTVSEAIPALGWVVVEKTPAPHVGESRASSEFYSNKILKDFKGKDQMQVDWVNAINGFLKELQAFVKQHHTTGLSWNPKGGDASSASVSAPAQSSGGPPPPGPPPPPAVEQSSGSSKAPVDTSKLFAELNKGGAVTSGLKKVTNDMKTKNRSESEKSSVIKAAEPKETKAPTKTSAPAKPPKFVLEGSKWCVEHQINNRDIVISDIEAKQVLYAFKCKNTTIQVKGKINAITLDNCERTSIVFENLVASLDIVNCNSVEVQVLGRVPSISIDKTSGLQLFLGKDALDTEIFTSKSDSMNVLLPAASQNDDPVEIAVPEQYKTVIKGGKLITEANTHV